MAHLVGTVNLGDVGHEVQDTAGVAPLYQEVSKTSQMIIVMTRKVGGLLPYLVVVPADELDEVLVQGNACLGIEDGGGGVAVQVGGDDLVLGVSEDSWGKRQLCMHRKQRGTQSTHP
jgi:hypothetical protein